MVDKKGTFILKKLPSKKWIIKFNLSFSLITLVLMALFVRLGIWQFNRSQEKDHLLLQYQENLNQSILEGNSLFRECDRHLSEPLKAFRFKQFTFQGNWLNDVIILLDNQVINKQVGFQVYSLFKLTHSDHIILIDRGFMPSLNQNRQNLTKLSSDQSKHFTHVNPSTQPTKTLKITGRLILPNKGFALNSNRVIEKLTDHIILLQQIDYDKLSHCLGYNIANFVIKLEPESSDGFIHTPIQFGLTATKHLAYALQWFCMAIAIFLYYCLTTIKVIKTNEPY